MAEKETKMPSDPKGMNVKEGQGGKSSKPAKRPFGRKSSRK